MQIGVIADVVELGSTLELHDVCIYPVGASEVNLGQQQVRLMLRLVEDEARALGFLELRIIADRLSGAAAGRHVDFRRTL